MQLPPEVKAQLDEQKKQCVFCKIVKGEIPPKKVFEDDKTLAMLDIYPAVKGHTIFMPKEHYPIIPYMPPEDFNHFFGLIPALSKAIKSGIVSVGFNILISSGGAAGQQAAHFLVHMMPRDEGDGFFNFYFLKKGKALDQEKTQILVNNFPLIMDNFFKRNPAAWHSGKGSVPEFLKEIYHRSLVLYEDEKVLCVLAVKNAAPGHIEIYSKVEEKDIDKLSPEDCIHLFQTASSTASLLFDGLKSQGTNILLRSGKSDDNPQGRLCIHVLPRMPNDSLQGIIWEPKQPKYEIDKIMDKIKDKTWKIKAKKEEKKEKKIEMNNKPEVITISAPTEKNIINTTIPHPTSAQDEIMAAIEKISK